MDIRPLTPDYAVSPQIEPDDLAAIADAGYTTVICNRPDMENPPAWQSDAMRAIAEGLGLTFVFLPFTHQTLNEEIVREQAKALKEANGPVLAYCASGTRCSVIWSFTQAGHLSADQILQATTRAGYQLDGLRPQLEALAAGS